MTWDPLPTRSTFERARRKEAYRRFGRLVRRESAKTLPALEDVQARLRIFDQVYVGIRPIPVDRIVGSVDRATDFDKDFLPKTSELRSRWKSVEAAYPQGDFPPITVYQVDGSYFVVDGHHRVAVAKQRRVATIDAEVTKLNSRYELPPSLDLAEIIAAEQQRIFLQDSGLDRARPEAVIEFSRPPGYVELLELVKVHGYHLIRERDEILSTEEIAGDWYDRIYLPTVAAIRDEQLTIVFPRATEADLFLWIYQRWRTFLPDRGAIPLPEAVREATEESGRKLGKKARRAITKIPKT